MVRTENMRAAAVDHSLTSDGPTSGQAMYDIITTDLTPDLVRFTGPFRVLYAAPPTMPIAPDMLGIFYRTAYSGAPQAEVELIPDAYHFIMWDEPARFQRELREFLTAPAG
jgi:pimeloyl-ACP methyl ester carboxylesterase